MELQFISFLDKLNDSFNVILEHFDRFWREVDCVFQECHGIEKVHDCHPVEIIYKGDNAFN